MATKTNIVSLIAQFITPEMLGRVSSAMGIDRASVQKAASAGVPGILAALMSVLAKPGGADNVESAVAQQDPGLLASLSRMIGTPEQESTVEDGFSSLSSLLGGNVTSALASALNRYAGLGDTGAKGLLGLLGPLVMGVLGQQVAGGRGTGSVAQLLESQADNIARALPAGFAGYLKGTGILRQLPDIGAAQASRMQSERATDVTQRNWAIAALAALAVIGLGWYLLSRPGPQTTAEMTPTETQAGLRSPGDSGFIVAEQDVGTWIRKPVYSSDNRKIGEIAELKRGPQDHVTDVYVDGETFLGMGGQRYRVSGDQIREVKPDGLVLSLTEADVKALPGTTAPAPAP
jgi:hypothetical protein